MQQLKKFLEDIGGKLPEMKNEIAALQSQVRARSWANMPGVNEGKEKFSMFKTLTAIKTNDWSEAGYEKAVMDEAKKKSMGYTSDTAGGYLVPQQAIAELIELLLPRSCCLEMGARLLPNLMGNPVTFPKQTGGATIYWIGDNTSVTPSDLTFAQLSLVPHKAMALIQVSNSLIRMALPAAEQIINEDIARQLALAIDLAALRGTGSANQPLGIANTKDIGTASGLTSGNGNGKLLSLNIFDDCEYSLAAANALAEPGGSYGYIFHPAVRRILKKIKIGMYSGDAGVLPLVSFLDELGVSTDQSIRNRLGYPFACTTQIPVNLSAGSYTDCTEIYFGNWAELLIGQWAGLRIQASDVAGTAFAADQTWIRIIAEIDVGLRHPQSFCLVNDISST